MNAPAIDVPFRDASPVTQEEVYQACREMMGEYPPEPPQKLAPVNKIREHLGNRGSNNTIQKYRDMWAVESRKKAAPDPAGGGAKPTPQPVETESAKVEDKNSDHNSGGMDLEKSLGLIRRETDALVAAETMRFKEFMKDFTEIRASQAASEARLEEREKAEQRISAIRDKANSTLRRGVIITALVATALGGYIGWSYSRIQASIVQPLTRVSPQEAVPPHAQTGPSKEEGGKVTASDTKKESVGVVIPDTKKEGGLMNPEMKREGDASPDLKTNGISPSP